MTAPSVYLAGPEVFLPDAFELGRAKQAICSAHGLVGAFPFDATEALGDLDHLPPPDVAQRYFDAMTAQIDGCAAVIANMTPFRGPSTDVGTAWEMGYAFGRGLPVFAYTNSAVHYGERIAPDGLMVEAFDLADNLMLAASVAARGGVVERRDVGATGAAAIAVLDGFEACVVRAAAVLLA
jgi:nucleoside 2-deoxyribosyltransferase